MILQLFLGGRRSDGGVDWLGEVEGSSTRTRGWAGAVSEHGVGGAQREPGHRDRTGPWTRTRPAAVMDTGRLQTVLVYSFLLIVLIVFPLYFKTIVSSILKLFFSILKLFFSILKLFFSILKLFFSILKLFFLYFKAIFSLFKHILPPIFKNYFPSIPTCYVCSLTQQPLQSL